MSSKYDLTVVLPCRDEKNTVGKCVQKLKDAFNAYNIVAEIIVVDNASSDNSRDIATKAGAKTYLAKRVGYGYALRRGIRKAEADYIVMCDADLTYDAYEVISVYRTLKQGDYDMVIGDRFKGGISKGAMPLSHKIGVRALSLLGRIKFHNDVRDYHCGLRGLTKEAADKLTFKTGGMEFATEMIAQASKTGLSISQIPVHLRCCPYSRKSKLRTVRDGFRHVRFIISN